jgi:tetratricopeptide (TPR) repeat protein
MMINMRRMLQRSLRWRPPAVALGVLLSLILFVPGHVGVAADAPPSGLQGTMRDIFQALTAVFPVSLNAEQFQDPAQYPIILAALRALAHYAEGLTMHGQDVPRHLDFLRYSLANDAQQALYWYEHGQYQAAQFALHRLTEHCFACHSKLPPPRRFVLGQQFLAAAPLAHLSLKERARLAVAARQFDTAMELYETLFQSSAITAEDIGLMGAFEDYLKIVLRVQNDFKRALLTLERFQQRSDVPYYLTQYVASWVEALKELQSAAAPDEALPYARALIREGQQRNRFPADRLGLVHFVVASSLLHRYVDTRPATDPALAEAYYLLGVAEAYISRSLWISETEFFLETAIYLAPKSVHARKAYAFLEEYVLVGYTGSSGLHLPADVRAHLAELRRLVDGS